LKIVNRSNGIGDTMDREMKRFYLRVANNNAIS